METTKSRDELVVEHMGLVRSIAARLAPTLPSHVPLDDLIGAGEIGLMQAAASYEPGRAANFAVFAKHRIRGAMLDSLRDLDWASRDERRYLRSVEKHIMRGEEGWQEKARTLALAMKIDLQRAGELLATASQNLSIDSPLITHNSHDENILNRQIIGNEDYRPDRMYERAELASTLRNAMDTALTPRYQMVVELYYAGEMSMKEIGSTLGINESRVSQIHKAALEKLRAALDPARSGSSALTPAHA